MDASTPIAEMMTGLLMVAGPYPPDVSTTISPPESVTDSAAARVRQGAAGEQLAEVLESSPVNGDKSSSCPGLCSRGEYKRHRQQVQCLSDAQLPSLHKRRILS